MAGAPCFGDWPARAMPAGDSILILRSSWLGLDPSRRVSHEMRHSRDTPSPRSLSAAELPPRQKRSVEEPWMKAIGVMPARAPVRRGSGGARPAPDSLRVVRHPSKPRLPPRRSRLRLVSGRNWGHSTLVVDKPRAGLAHHHKARHRQTIAKEVNPVGDVCSVSLLSALCCGAVSRMLKVLRDRSLNRAGFARGSKP